MSPSTRRRNARWRTKATSAMQYAPTATPNRTSDAGVLPMVTASIARGCNAAAATAGEPRRVPHLCKGTPSGAPIRRGARTMSPMGGRPRILLADGDPRVLQVVSRYLDLEGYEMDTVADGEAAVETAAAN